MVFGCAREDAAVEPELAVLWKAMQGCLVVPDRLVNGPAPIEHLTERTGRSLVLRIGLQVVTQLRCCFLAPAFGAEAVGLGHRVGGGLSGNGPA